MTDDTEDRQPAAEGRKRIVLGLAALAFVLVVLFVPPLISINHYKSRITQLMTASLGRPVRLSSVELHLLPWPAFVLTDLSVAEDPAYGAEPVLHANTVTASIRLTSLWRGRMEISRISVDEASLNLVRASPGQWNINELFRTVAAHAGVAGAAPSPAVRLPYLEATNSRINIKNVAEKLPFSLINTDLSFWQDDSGAWRIRLRGQPARTDLSLDLGDTGVMRLEASMGRAPSLQQMPVHLDLDWREAQLGQLAQLIIGADPGWRGDLTGELHLDGTADAAQVKTRLRATGVHRTEFAPAEPLDFDANCSFVYHSSRRALQKLVCDSPLGRGLVRLTGDLPRPDAPPALSLELDRVPAAAALDVLRTVRSGLAPDLEAMGTISGKLAYADSAAQTALPQQPPKSGSAHASSAVRDPFTGSLTIEGFALSGGGLSQPLQAPRMVLAPTAPLPAHATHPQVLSGTVAVPAGGATPLTINLRLALDGYQATIRGQAALARARELVRMAGLAKGAALDNLAGDPASVDLSAQGRWLPDAFPVDATSPDELTGTVILRNTNWKTDYLANHVQISQATLHIDNGQLNWDPVAFSYGPVKGTASVTQPVNCPANERCVPQFQVQFADLNASDLEASFLGAHEPGTLLSKLIARLQPQQAPSWPEMVGTVKADSLVMGLVRLVEPSATLLIHPDRAEFSDLDARLLGGHMHVTGSLRWAGTDQAKPAYTVEAHFEKLSPEAVGQLLEERWAGGSFDGDAKIDLSGFTDKDLTASAKGTLQFDWRRGAVEAGGKGVPAALIRFDDWKAAAAIHDGTITLEKNQMVSGLRKGSVTGTLTFGEPPKLRFAVPKDTRAARR
jgi:hypothetical protein